MSDSDLEEMWAAEQRRAAAILDDIDSGAFRPAFPPAEVIAARLLAATEMQNELLAAVVEKLDKTEQAMTSLRDKLADSGLFRMFAKKG